MTASFADDKFAHLPIGDLQGIISLHKNGKEQQDVVMHERQICSSELLRINRSIITMGEITLPFMSGSSRSASVVRDARTGSVSQHHGGASSRSTSVQKSTAGNDNGENNRNQNNNNNNLVGDDPNARSESVAACSHEILDAVKIVTSFQSSIPDAKQPTPVHWKVESRIKNLRVNEMYDAALSQRKQEKKDNGTLRRPEFRKLAPLWNRHQHQKHQETSAKLFSSLGTSPYKADEEGNVADFADDKHREKHNGNKKLNQELMERNALNSLWAMQFALGGTATDAATAKKRDDDRKAVLVEETEARANSPSRKGKKNWTFQVPSLLSRRNGEEGAASSKEGTAAAAAEEEI